MKRKKTFAITISIFLCVTATRGIAQTAAAQLNSNNVKATVAADGVLFFDGYNSSSGYEVPASSGKQAIRAASLWIGGLDSLGQVHTAAMTYRGGSDFFFGPLDTITGTPTSCGQSSFYNNIWTICQKEIDTLLNYGFIYPAIANWPGNGNMSLNETKHLAPYNDVNGDGIYSPAAGDYPVIKGDQMLFWVTNDNCGPHTETGGLPFGVEVHNSAYAYGCTWLPDSQQVLNNTTFYHFRVINRSANKYDSVYFTFWVDAELGESGNDLAACAVDQRTAYFINGTTSDSVYGSSKTAVAITQLKGPFADVSDGVNNDMDSLYNNGTVLGPDIDETGEQCVFTNFMVYGDNITTNAGSPTPVNQYQYYNYMKSYWNDSLPMTYGGNGYNSGGTPGKYAFPGNSDPGGYGTGFLPQAPWYAYASAAIDQPSNKRILISAGPFTMEPNEVNECEYAVIFSTDSAAAATQQSAISKLHEETNKIRGWWQTQNFPNCNPPLMLGAVISDSVTNCIHDSTEHTLPNVMITSAASDGSILNHTFTDSAGNFSLIPGNAATSIQIIAPPYRNVLCPTSGNYGGNSFWSMDTISGLNFYITETAGITDVSTDIVSYFNPVAGQSAHYKITVKNEGTQNASGTLVIIADSMINIYNTFPAYTSQSGQTLSFNYSNLAPLNNYSVDIFGYYDTTVVLNDTLNFIAAATTFNTDSNLVDNVDTLIQFATGPYDPNDKIVFPSGNIAPTQTLEYVIRFQNTGTAPAINVKIIDRIVEYLDLSTFELVSSSSPCLLSINGGRYITFRFNNIMLPDSNSNEPASHGYVKFRIKPVSGIPEGTVIENNAGIYFDYNPAIYTYNTYNIIAPVTSVKELKSVNNAHVFPNPSSDFITVQTDNAFTNATLIIYELSGKEILKQHYSSRVKTDISTLAPGLYIIKVADKNATCTTRFIKQ